MARKNLNALTRQKYLSSYGWLSANYQNYVWLYSERPIGNMLNEMKRSKNYHYWWAFTLQSNMLVL